MVAEDDAAVLETVQVMLGDRYDIIPATNGEEAVRKYKMFKTRSCADGCDDASNGWC